MMNSSVTVSAELGLSLVVPEHGSVPLVASLYYSADDPYAIRMAFHVGTDEPVEWIFARDLLAVGRIGQKFVINSGSRFPGAPETSGGLMNKKSLVPKAQQDSAQGFNPISTLGNAQAKISSGKTPEEILVGVLQFPVIGDQGIGGAVMLQIRLGRFVKFGNDPRSENFAELNAPLIERVNVPDHPLGKYAVLV